MRALCSRVYLEKYHCAASHLSPKTSNTPDIEVHIDCMYTNKTRTVIWTLQCSRNILSISCQINGISSESAGSQSVSKTLHKQYLKSSAQ